MQSKKLTWSSVGVNRRLRRPWSYLPVPFSLNKQRKTKKYWIVRTADFVLKFAWLMCVANVRDYGDYSWLARDVMKFKELPKFLSSSSRRCANFISVYNFLAQQHASFGNQCILNFRVMAVRDINLWSWLAKKYIIISVFFVICEVKTLGKVFM